MQAGRTRNEKELDYGDAQALPGITHTPLTNDGTHA
jgi:hypothetical protein